MTSISFTRAVRSRLPVTLALGALAFMSAGAQAADYDEITISPPNVKTVGRGDVTNAPIQEISKQATVKFEPVQLTTNSGVALLKDSVFDAALKVCNSITLTMADADENEDSCIRDALKSAQAQVDAAVARARATTNG
jgi:UrcA family protein